MLNEIVRARRVIGVHTKRNKKPYTLKKETISNSLYGVDLDPGAVEIAKLRLWLSLVVDENEPHPLPNLDHKIMQGNSLISEYEGIKLFDDTIFSNSNEDDFQIREIEQRIKEVGQDSKKLIDQGIISGEKFNQILSESKSLQRKLKKLKQEKIEKPESRSLFDEPEQINILEEKTKELTEKTQKYIDESGRSGKQSLKRDIDQLKWEIIEMTLRKQGREDKIDELEKLRRKNIKPFFIWKLEFADVFKQKGGFDTVIGNPPYVQLQKNGGFLADMFQDAGYETFVRSGDIYALFYEHGNHILNNNGHLAFITSNKWMRAGYGEKLRKYLSENTTPKLLIDLGSGIFETATVDTNILLFQKNKSDILCNACDVKINLIKENILLENYIQKNLVKLTNFSSDTWVVINEIEAEIKNKIEKVNNPLKDWDIQINRGILTGYNEAFIIDSETKLKLINEDINSEEIIKPILRGKDIKRYGMDFADKWLIYAHSGIEIKKYEAIHNHLLMFKDNLIKRTGGAKVTGDPTSVPYKWYELQVDYYKSGTYKNFSKNKIIWQEMVQEGGFLLDTNDMYCNDTGRILIGEDLEYLLSILNSKLFFYGVKNFYGGGGLGSKAIRMKNTFFEKFSVPKISKEDQAPFIDLVNQILEITSSEEYNPKNVPERQKQIEAKIDEMVMDLYKLTDEEKEIIRNS